MSSLTRLALEVLEEKSMPLGVRSVACVTLLHALDGGIAVPNGAHVAVWRFLLGSEASAVVLHRHALQHPEVAADAVRVLLDRETGEGERDLALAVLRDSNLDLVTEDPLANIVDHVLSEGRARQVGFLIDRVHEQRGLSAPFLVALRDRLATSDAAPVRTVAVEVTGLLPKLDEPFVARMFRDPSPVVRSATADLLERTEEQDRPQALALIRERLVVEQHRSVISACLYALGSLVRTTGRRVRQWEPPEGTGN
jgi:hypothetical protein